MTTNDEIEKAARYLWRENSGRRETECPASMIPTEDDLAEFVTPGAVHNPVEAMLFASAEFAKTFTEAMLDGNLKRQGRHTYMRPDMADVLSRAAAVIDTQPGSLLWGIEGGALCNTNGNRVVAIWWCGSNGVIRFATLDEVDNAWRRREREGAKCPYPLIALVAMWRLRPEPVETRHFHVMKLPDDAGAPMSKSPALLNFASGAIEAIKVDGEAFATRAAADMRKYRPRRDPNDMFDPPRKLNKEPINDIVIATTAGHALTDDDRSPLRNDIHKTALAVFALTGQGATITQSQGAVFVGGRDTDANRQRWHSALTTAAGMYIIINTKTGEPRNLLVADFHDGGADVRPPAWWIKDKPAWRLTGGLYRPASIGGRMVKHETGGLHRMITGLETVLTWSPSGGGGRDGRLPRYLRARVPGGPGEEIFVPWREVLRRSGDYVTAKTPFSGRAGMRYGRRVNALLDAGYGTPTDARGTPTNAAAPAGDTVEIRRAGGGNGRESGLWIRASARFCAAAAQSKIAAMWDRMPANQLFG